MHINRISAIDKETFQGLTSLKNLRLNHNQILSIDKDTFRGLHSLEELWLNGNKISVVEKETFQGLTSLQNLTLDNNQISSFHPETFRGLHALRELLLHTNRISHIDKNTFKGLNSLTKLYLYQNRIAVIEPATFADLRSLEILYLWGNQLCSIASGVFRNLHKLETLLLNGNQILNIQYEAFHSLFSLKLLDLHNNQLVDLNPNLLVNLPRYPLQLGLSQVSADPTRNKWNCLSLCWLKHEEQQGTIRWWVPPSLGTEGHPICTVGSQWNSLQCPEPGEWPCAQYHVKQRDLMDSLFTSKIRHMCQHRCIKCGRKSTQTITSKMVSVPRCGTASQETRTKWLFFQAFVQNQEVSHSPLEPNTMDPTIQDPRWPTAAMTVVGKPSHVRGMGSGLENQDAQVNCKLLWYESFLCFVSVCCFWENISVMTRVVTSISMTSTSSLQFPPWHSITCMKIRSQCSFPESPAPPGDIRGATEPTETDTPGYDKEGLCHSASHHRSCCLFSFELSWEKHLQAFWVLCLQISGFVKVNEIVCLVNLAPPILVVLKTEKSGNLWMNLICWFQLNTQVTRFFIEQNTTQPNLFFQKSDSFFIKKTDSNMTPVWIGVGAGAGILVLIVIIVLVVVMVVMRTRKKWVCLLTNHPLLLQCCWDVFAFEKQLCDLWMQSIPVNSNPVSTSPRLISRFFCAPKFIFPCLTPLLVHHPTLSVSFSVQQPCQI